MTTHNMKQLEDILFTNVVNIGSVAVVTLTDIELMLKISVLFATLIFTLMKIWSARKARAGKNTEQ